MFKTIFYFVIPALAFSCTPPKHWQGITFAEYISVPNGKLPVVLEVSFFYVCVTVLLKIKQYYDGSRTVCWNPYPPFRWKVL